MRSFVKLFATKKKTKNEKKKINQQIVREWCVRRAAVDTTTK